MFVGFNLTEFNLSFPSKFYEKGMEIFNKNVSSVSASLEKYIVDDDTLSADSIMDEWFPQVDAHVFISHSHKDIKKVIGFAGWIKEKAGIDAFVDSCVWEHCEKLVNKLKKNTKRMEII